MTQPRPMSTPIFDELLREFASRMEEHRSTQPDQPEPVPQGQAAQVAHRHRAD